MGTIDLTGLKVRIDPYMQGVDLVTQISDSEIVMSMDLWDIICPGGASSGRMLSSDELQAALRGVKVLDLRKYKGGLEGGDQLVQDVPRDGVALGRILKDACLSRLRR